MFRARRTRLRGEQGFTLVELIVVLFILGVLIVLAVLTYNRVRHRAPHGVIVAPPGAHWASKNIDSVAMPIERSIQGMNVLVFLTDQERAIQQFPRGWRESICLVRSACQGTG